MLRAGWSGLPASVCFRRVPFTRAYVKPKRGPFMFRLSSKWLNRTPGSVGPPTLSSTRVLSALNIRRKKPTIAKLQLEPLETSAAKRDGISTGETQAVANAVDSPTNTAMQALGPDEWLAKATEYLQSAVSSGNIPSLREVVAQLGGLSHCKKIQEELMRRADVGNNIASRLEFCLLLTKIPQADPQSGPFAHLLLGVIFQSLTLKKKSLHLSSTQIRTLIDYTTQGSREPNHAFLKAAKIWADLSRHPDGPSELQLKSLEVQLRKPGRVRILRFLLGAFAHSRDKRTFELLLALAKKHDIPLNGPAFDFIFWMCDDLKSALQWEPYIDEHGPALTRHALVRLFSLAASENNLSEATRLKEKFSQRIAAESPSPGKTKNKINAKFAQCFPDVGLTWDGQATPDSIPQYISHLSGAKKYEEVLTMYRAIKEHNYSSANPQCPSWAQWKMLVMWTQIMQAASHLKDLEAIATAYDKLIEIDPYPNETTLAVIADALGHSGQIRKLVNLWVRITTNTDKQPAINCWTSFIEALSKNDKFATAFSFVSSLLTSLQKGPHTDFIDLKFAKVFVKLIGKKSLGPASFYKLLPRIPRFLHPVPSSQLQLAKIDNIRCLTKDELDLFVKTFHLLSRALERKSARLKSKKRPVLPIGAFARPPVAFTTQKTLPSLDAQIENTISRLWKARLAAANPLLPSPASTPAPAPVSTSAPAAASISSPATPIAKARRFETMSLKPGKISPDLVLDKSYDKMVTLLARNRVSTKKPAGK